MELEENTGWGELILPRRRPRTSLFWAILLGLLIVFGACGMSVLSKIRSREQPGIIIGNARQIVLALMLQPKGTDDTAESLEDALRQAGVEKPDIARLSKVGGANGEQKPWIYFKQVGQHNGIGQPTAVLVSPVFPSGNTPPGLAVKRIVAMSDCSVQVVTPSFEVPLPDGRMVKVADLK